jgi:hypothetical protein
MRGNAQRAVMIDRPRRMGMRRLHHPAHQHEADAQDGKHRNPVQSDSGADRVHAADSTINRAAGKPQTGETAYGERKRSQRRAKDGARGEQKTSKTEMSQRGAKDEWRPTSQLTTLHSASFPVRSFARFLLAFRSLLARLPLASCSPSARFLLAFRSLLARLPLDVSLVVPLASHALPTRLPLVTLDTSCLPGNLRDSRPAPVAGGSAGAARFEGPGLLSR